MVKVSREKKPKDPIILLGWRNTIHSAIADVQHVIFTEHFFVCKGFLVQRDWTAESRRDEVAPPLCIHKFLTNKTNVSVNGLCHIYIIATPNFTQYDVISSSLVVKV